MDSAPSWQSHSSSRMWRPSEEAIGAFLLCIVLLIACGSMMGKFAWPRADRTALVVTAHPDDEVMFFSPSIRALQDSGYSVMVACASTGGSSCCCFKGRGDSAHCRGP
jgi:hypothetical protein